MTSESYPELSDAIARLGRAHGDRALDESDFGRDPIAQFAAWMEAALNASLTLPNAMTLATADRYGRPSARMLLLKGVDERGFVFYTNYDSPKAKELERNPLAALLFYWSQLERQVRVEGSVARVSTEESEAYFRTRPRASQLSVWASYQSEVIESREVLEERFRAVESRYAGVRVPLPPYWGGYRLVPEVVEFWQGRPNRLHDRLRYRRLADAGWLMERLSP